MVENCGLLLLVNYGLTVVELYGLWFLVDMIVNHVDSMFLVYRPFSCTPIGVCFIINVLIVSSYAFRFK